TLLNSIKKHENEIANALEKDFNKSAEESYMTEIGLVLDEIRYHKKHLKQWMKKQKVKTPLAQFPSVSFRLPEPRGCTLIMSPWNYPCLLCLSPLVGVISSGCTAIVKPSAYAPCTSAIISKMLGDIFLKEYICVVEGGRKENSALLDQKFDYIFFTGSKSVGKIVLQKASSHLTPVTLELGGKSPCIVDKTANLKIAARRIAFGKILNAGQTCVAPDYLFIHESVKNQFIREYEIAVKEFFPNGDMSSMNVIINEKHFLRVCKFLKNGKIVFGGDVDKKRRFISPTLIDEVSFTDKIMMEEIFAPILPIISFSKIDECINYIQENSKPLALYLFTKDKSVEEKIFAFCSFGGGCVNDTVIHLATPFLPFGGIGESGMGCYHGKASFDTFSHYKSIVKKSTLIDIPIRYRPYTALKQKFLRVFLH
ncbi:MAG: aldehyde dehydrogenase, partial [Treponema sp.]|nr:aldehyde dehydrogenase [Treponema sp.]